jgi:hypothetical protein
VFAACAYLEDLEARGKGAGWFDETSKEGENS